MALDFSQRSLHQSLKSASVTTQAAKNVLPGVKYVEDAHLHGGFVNFKDDDMPVCFWPLLRGDIFQVRKSLHRLAPVVCGSQVFNFLSQEGVPSISCPFAASLRVEVLNTNEFPLRGGGDNNG